MTQALRQHFRPEFLNRVDDIIIFRPLGTEQIEHIVELQLDAVREAARRSEADARADARARSALLAEEGYDPAFGARPLKRAIQRLIQNPLALQILEGKFQEGDHIVVDAKGRTASSRSTKPARRARRRPEPAACEHRARVAR